MGLEWAVLRLCQLRLEGAHLQQKCTDVQELGWSGGGEGCCVQGWERDGERTATAWEWASSASASPALPLPPCSAHAHLVRLRQRLRRAAEGSGSQHMHGPGTQCAQPLLACTSSEEMSCISFCLGRQVP